MNKKAIFSAVLLLGFFLSCKQIALMTTQSKKEGEKQTFLQIKANEYFLEHFEAGNYDSIPRMLFLLTAAYLLNPNDVETTTRLAFLHMWALSERSRDSVLDPRITEHALLAKKYFSEAWLLGDKKDARLHGFLAATMMVEGKLDNDLKKTVSGYFEMREAIREFPEFNYFTAGYVLSQAPKDDKRYAEAVAWQWKSLDACAGKKVDRTDPDYSEFMNRETHEGPKRVCWNSPMVPHNLEGFFLNMGDMLVKQGDWETATKIYRNAMLSDTYDTWPYKSVLEDRINNACENTDHFNRDSMPDDSKRIMVNTAFSCMACHQRKSESLTYPTPNSGYYFPFTEKQN